MVRSLLERMGLGRGPVSRATWHGRRPWHEPVPERRPPGECAPRDADLPPGTEWQWRPDLFGGCVLAVAAPASGHRLGRDAALWHDCSRNALSLRPMDGPQPGGGHPLEIGIRAFSGSFLSVTLDLPGALSAILGPDRILQLDLRLQADPPVRVYARLNLVQGPNTETMLRQTGEPEEPGGRQRVAFDLAYGDLAGRPVERAWLDVILDAPRGNALILGDARLSGRPRAHI